MNPLRNFFLPDAKTILDSLLINVLSTTIRQIKTNVVRCFCVSDTFEIILDLSLFSCARFEMLFRFQSYLLRLLEQ